jgi:hypothetical protein
MNTSIEQWWSEKRPCKFRLVIRNIVLIGLVLNPRQKPNVMKVLNSVCCIKVTFSPIRKLAVPPLEKDWYILHRRNKNNQPIFFPQCLLVTADWSVFSKCFLDIKSLPSHRVPLQCTGKGKGKVQPRTSNEGPEGE